MVNLEKRITEYQDVVTVPSSTFFVPPELPTSTPFYICTSLPAYFVLFFLMVLLLLVTIVKEFNKKL